MDDREVPHYFICAISLQIMKDPVTVATGITYDRDSIQRWQFHGQNNTCPVTNQPLPIGSDFTPNHNLRRLIQAWCVSVSDQLPPPNQPSFHKEFAMNLIKNLKLPEMQLESLKRLENLASENQNYRVFLKEVAVVQAMVSIVVSCYQNGTIVGLKEALNVLYLVGFTQDETSSILDEEHDLIIDSLTWVLDFSACDDTTMKFHAIVSLKNIIHNAKSHVLERLKRDFFKTIVLLLRQQEYKKLEQGTKEGLHVMLSTCTWPRNCSMMIEAGAVFELVELELGSLDKPTTELIMAVLFHLCCSADGRAQLLGHAAGIAMITKRIGKVSPKVDERALMIISLISKFSATDGVLNEMVRVGTIEKLMMVLQVNGRHSYPRDKAREILKRHSNVWKDSPCLDATLLTRYPS
ncbi:E3 ubiquitin-protein ligase PUB24-like [Cynara cardunculus var. scolymus]|uniref:U-box domain-containing protein n=1 Tax=Cynara cardunculus var. scolymus TaxID=59895 RepID=A0A103XDQ1_CYNCS|nr:E3 ubiquitin-protein ligase PUB24-like [Cynara cardunculus var. scolymus]KVH88776.1 Armadillo-like helical [Cynara cardunculus var. scolymus]